MIRLPNTINVQPNADIKRALKNELEALPAGSLPLENYTIQGGMVDDRNITITVLSVVDLGQSVAIKFGVFFTEIVGGCNCHDDPIEEPAYAEIQARINKLTCILSFD